MTYLRYLTMGVATWLFLVHGIGNLLGEGGFAPFLYGIVLAVTALLILLPSAYRASPTLFVVSAVAVLFLVKVWRHDPIDASSLPMAIAEMGVIGLTIVLAWALAKRLGEAQESFSALVTGTLGDGAEGFATGQRLLYREVRRARRFGRHLVVLAVAPNAASLEQAINRSRGQAESRGLVDDMQREVLARYISARIATLLVDELEDGAVVTQRGDHFLLLLPETNREEAGAVTDQLKAASETKLGIRLDIGTSAFPEEAVTLEGLLQQAEAAMAGQPSEARKRQLVALGSPSGNRVHSLTSQ